MITRPLEEAEATAEDIKKIGFFPLINSLSEVKIRDLQGQDIKYFEDQSQILIISSVNALKAICKFDISKNFSMILVGKSNFYKAKEYGYNNIIFYGKDMNEVLDYILVNYHNQHIKFLYLSGNIISKDLIVPSEEKNVIIRRLVVYNIDYKYNFSNEASDIIKAGYLYGVILFSAEVAKVFQRLVLEYNLKYFLETKIFCLSNRVKNNVDVFPGENVFVSKNPDYSSMIDLVLSQKENS